MIKFSTPFKRELSKIHNDIRKAVWIEDFNRAVNEDLWEALIKIFNTSDANPGMSPLNVQNIAADTWITKYIKTVLANANSICEEFIWVTTWEHQWLYSFGWLATVVNAYYPQISTQEEHFTKWKIVRVKAIDTLKKISMYPTYGWQTFKQCIWKHYQVIWYTPPAGVDILEPFEISYKWALPVYVKDLGWSVYKLPQTIFTPTTIKNLKDYEQKKMLNDIEESLRDSHKYEEERVTKEYQKLLADFMDVSRLLHERMNIDFRKAAEEIVANKLKLKKQLLTNPQVDSVEYDFDKRLLINTKPLVCNNNPVWRYSIDINLKTWWLRILNLDIWTTWCYQHPHVWSAWEPCLGDRANPLRKSFSEHDYITLMLGVISYLEEYNHSSVYITMSDFQSRNSAKFKYQKELMNAKKTTVTPKPEDVTEIINIQEMLGTDEPVIIPF